MLWVWIMGVSGAGRGSPVIQTLASEGETSGCSHLRRIGNAHLILKLPDFDRELPPT